MAAWLRSTARWSTSAEPSSTSAASLKRRMMRSRTAAARSTSCSGFSRSLRGCGEAAAAARRLRRHAAAAGGASGELRRSIRGWTSRETEDTTRPLARADAGRRTPAAARKRIARAQSLRRNRTLCIVLRSCCHLRNASRMRRARAVERFFAGEVKAVARPTKNPAADCPGESGERELRPT